MASKAGRAVACALATVAVLVAAAPASAQVVWAVGDGGVVESTDDQLAAYIEGRGAFERFVYLGDVYETGTAEEFAQNYHTSFGRFKQRSSPTPGNHEWDNRASGYDPYWGSLAPQTDGGHYYSFDLGKWHFVSLNSEEAIDASSPQIAWLKQDLARYKGTCTIAFIHKPRHTATPGIPERTGLQAAWEALEGRAAALLAGHDHNYQRFHPINGLAQFVVGTGGRTFHSVAADPRLAYSNDQVVGALRLDLSRGGARYEFFASGGAQPLDSGSLTCTPHDSPPTAAFDWSPDAPTAGQEVTFSSTSSDPDGALTAVAWDLDGDGEYDDAEGATATRTFGSAGSFRVGLRVTDGQGDSSTAIRHVDVGSAPGGDPPPRPDPLASRLSVVSPKHGAVHSRRLRTFRGKVTAADGPVSVTLIRRGRSACARFDGRRFVRASCRTRAGVLAQATARWRVSLPRSLRLQPGTYRLTARIAGADGVKRLAGVTFRVR